MGALNRILATTDLHEKSEAGLKFAAAIAKDYGADFHVLHVMTAQDIGDLDLPTHTESHMRTDATTAAQGKLAGHLNAIFGGDSPPCTSAVVFGSPAMEILKYAREQQCSAVVITVSTRSRVGKLLLGSDTLEMLTISDLPVIVVPVGD